MANYIIEGNVDFFKMINETDENNNVENEIIDDENAKVCLITNEPLTEYHTTLGCGHSFNYLPLYNEVYTQKKIRNRLEVTQLSKTQIKCPYCRNVQNNLLPFIPLIISTRVDGVNHPIKYCKFLHTCNYLFKSGKKKGEMCAKKCNDPMCRRHTNVTICEHKCNIVLKSGKNKGNSCDCAVFKEDKCKRHYTLANK